MVDEARGPIRRILIAALVSLGAFVILFGLCIGLGSVGLPLDTFFSEKWGILIPLCIGLPLGTVAGILVAERTRKPRLRVVALGASFATALGGVYITLLAMDLFGGIAIVASPLITTVAGYAGFCAVGCASARWIR